MGLMDSLKELKNSVTKVAGDVTEIVVEKAVEAKAASLGLSKSAVETANNAVKNVKETIHKATE